ncbi:2088_t:CDS:1 [Cetraspora pellucida]|uniref:2088_t:CDS:1 n=1 Tax=Cetraspora pellucida TaxID=1433469 RepID=A0A9N9IX77_9GLOM|nr:2088_t:CDS:1 [Cetraspora pellucida]
MTHPEISNELEILSNVHFSLEFPTGIATPDGAVGQIPKINSGPVSIQHVFQQRTPQPHPLVQISTTDSIPPFFEQSSAMPNSIISFPPSPTSPLNFPSGYPSPPQRISHEIRNDALFPAQFSDTVANPLTQSSPTFPNQSAVCLTNVPQNGMVTPPMMMNGHNYYHSYHQMIDHSYEYRLMAEENKRRRNTAASARFRIKKKMREQALEKTSQDMAAKAEMLEKKVRELEKEIKWLKCLIIEKDARLLDIERPKEQFDQN